MLQYVETAESVSVNETVENGKPNVVTIIHINNKGGKQSNSPNPETTTNVEICKISSIPSENPVTKGRIKKKELQNPEIIKREHTIKTSQPSHYSRSVVTSLVCGKPLSDEEQEYKQPSDTEDEDEEEAEQEDVFKEEQLVNKLNLPKLWEIHIRLRK